MEGKILTFTMIFFLAFFVTSYFKIVRSEDLSLQQNILQTTQTDASSSFSYKNLKSFFIQNKDNKMQEKKYS